jgi:hypothetical protein
MRPSIQPRRVAWIATALLGLSSAQASDYYVSPIGSDSAQAGLYQMNLAIR